MNICMICGEFPPNCGGQGNYVYYLSKKLIQKGHEITVITRGSWRKTFNENVDNINVYRTRFLPTYPFHIQPHGFFVNRLFKSMNSKFDIVHFHSPIIPLVQTTLPSIVTEHGTAKGFIENLELKDVFSLVQKIFSRMYISIDRKVLNSADKVTSVSDLCAKELKRDYGIKEVDVVQNGVDTSHFIPNSGGREDKFVLYTGALVTKKGVIDLIKSAEYVCGKYPDIEFILTGKGPLEKHLKKLTHELGINKNFSFVGYVSQEKLLKYYQDASIYVLPSYYEGLPTVVLEAMSCELPVVATPVGGIPEVIQNGKTGFLVPPRNPKKLADTILKLLENGDLRKQIGINERKHVRKYFDWNVIADNIEKIYFNLMNNGG